ncbi:MAG: hypothetical protein C0621_05725 [Desulfuromonas sp.]|nr:MAG: hypothetical protein C0621_05725 [Desulfuromonas sp.]
MDLRGTVDEVVANGASADSGWDLRDDHGLRDLPYLVGTAKSDAEVTVTVEQSHDGQAIDFSETVSDVPGADILAAGGRGGFRFARVAPYVRLTFANASGGDAVVFGKIYGSD